MYRVTIYFSENSKKSYKNIEDIAQDFQFLEKPTKEGFYRDILTDDLIEILKENVDKKYTVINHIFINRKNYKSIEDIAQDFQLLQKPTKEGFYRDIEGNLIKIDKEDVQEA